MKEHRVTIPDVARHVGMSVSMVSSVLGHKSYCCASASTRRRIEAVARELGYRPNLLARGLKNGRSRVIGFVCDSVHHEVSAQEIVYLTDALLRLDYQVQVIYSRGEERLRQQACDRLVDTGCDAIIVSGNLAQMDLRTCVPIFLINGDFAGKDFDRSIFVDYQVGVEEALSCLREFGHEHIVLAASYWSNFPGDQRKLAFDAFLRRNGVSDVSERTLTFQKYSDITAQRLKGFLQQYPSCTGFICTNDLVAMRLIQVFAKLGMSVPQDFSVIGFDDNLAADFFVPSLSSIRQPTEKVISEVVKLVINTLEGSEQPVERVVPCYLVRRDSIGRARKEAFFTAGKNAQAGGRKTGNRKISIG